MHRYLHRRHEDPAARGPSIGATSKAGLASGIGDAFLAAGIIAAAASALALITLPSARSFLPKLALSPRVAVH